LSIDEDELVTTRLVLHRNTQYGHLHHLKRTECWSPSLYMQSPPMDWASLLQGGREQVPMT